MTNFVAKKDRNNSSGNQFSMYIGRWQPWHAGHRWLIDQRLSLGKNVLVCIRDVILDENNPYSPEEIQENLNTKLKDLIDIGRVKVMIIPDIESVNYGRGVGYDIIEHVPPQNVGEISASKLRNETKES